MQPGNIARHKPRAVPKKKEKLQVLIAKSALLRTIGRAFLALGLIQIVISQMSGTQADRGQMVQKMGAGISGYIQ